LEIQALLAQVIRLHLHALTPYATARDEFEGEAEIFLDANENPIGSITSALFNRYPDPSQKELKSKLAVLKNVLPEQIFLGNGSDEAIDLLTRLTCEPGQDEILILPPTYGMYEVSAGIHNVSVNKIPLSPDFQIDVNKVLTSVTAKTKLIWLCSPNNPTGNLLRQADMLAILQNFQGLVIVDEAYIDFSPEPSWIEKLADFPNLVVLQTFSKAWGLANLRVGMAFAHAEIIAFLNKIKAPYNLNGMTQKLVSESLQDVKFKDEMVSRILVQKEILTRALQKLPLVQKIYPSDANFLLVQFADAALVFNYLTARKIIVRDRSKNPATAGCLRITVGSAEENRVLVETLKNL
jgi:histidinol-phosphate aminotransferase